MEGVPPSKTIEGFFGGDYGLPSLSIGRVWIRVDGGSPCYHCDSYVYRLHRETGRAGPPEPHSTRVKEDLDDPRLWPPLCSPLRRTPNPEYDPDENSAFRFDQPLVFGTRALDWEPRNRVVLRRCGSRTTRVVTRSRRAQMFQVGGGFISWLEQTSYPERDGSGYAVVYEIATGKRRRWRIPGAGNPNVSVSHTRGHVYVDKTGPSGRASRRFVATMQ
jgi:hypothetical protein